ncbi:unnamed protein product, partial [Choristocarpus tenellus]
CYVGNWKSDQDRAMCWRILLGVIPKGTPPSRWRDALNSRRRAYQRLKADHIVDISKVVDQMDPLSVEPLSSGPDSSQNFNPWTSFYERKELASTIMADLERLYPSGCGEHFLDSKRQNLLLNVLSLWAATHPYISYRQGMHELYLIKWARLLFGREFPMRCVFLLWDHIFASASMEGGPEIPVCVEMVAVAMV